MLQAIVLDPVEQRIFALIRRFVADCRLDVVVRVAGGWVRDKLLGLPCHDLDLALDTLTGEDFATRLHAYLRTTEDAGASMNGGPGERIASAFGVIQSNPEQSKHLAAATLTLYGRPVDFVNLRSESYTDNSRIPAATFGTALEDALRRDLTINALFYNLGTGQVEDLTGHGLPDLSNGIIRTPLDPLVTLRDDPLRLLRAIRFASRFRYRMEPTLVESMQERSVVRAFFDKISRERVGIEMFKMCQHRNRLASLRLVADIPPVYAFIVGEEHGAKRPLFCQYLSRLEQLLSYRADDCFTHVGALGCIFLPFSGEETIDASKPSRPITVSTTRHLMSTMLKSSARDAADVSTVVDHCNEIVATFTDGGASLEGAADDTVRIGRLIRKLGKLWSEAFLMARLRGANFDDVKATAAVHSRGLDACYEWKPLLSGHDVQRSLPHVAAKDIGKVLQACLDWQFAHPEGSAADCLQHVLLLFPSP